MPKFTTADTVAQRVQQLIDQRQVHADAIAQIDSTLERVGVALANGSPKRGRRTMLLATKTPAEAPRQKRSQRRRRHRFANSAEESILSFVKGHKSPTTQDIKKFWADEGRGGTADNALSKLVKEKKLKRNPLEGMRGSKFALA